LTDQKHIRIYKQRELRFIEAGYKKAVAPVYEDIAQTLASVEDVACRKGCAHCCKLKVEVLPPEVAIIVDHVRNNFPPALRQSILDKLKSNSVVESTADANEYREADLRCAFLGGDDLCMVYDVRPMNCRAFGSTNVNVCNLSEPDDEKTTFSATPDSMMMLVATSGLFWTGFHQAALDYWMGLPITVTVTDEQMEVVLAVRQLLDKAHQDGTTASVRLAPT
jgi:Fe-S-cluster containining protein